MCGQVGEENFDVREFFYWRGNVRGRYRKFVTIHFYYYYDCGDVMSTELKETKAMIGLCTDYFEPDIWFPETASKAMSGATGFYRPSTEYRVQVSLEAILLCDVCPTKASCLVEGMREENINHGIWGGMMVSERRRVAGLPAVAHSDISDVKVARIVRKKLKKIYEKNNS